MSTEDNKALARRAYEEGLNQRNLAVFDELNVPDFVSHSASTTMQGLEAFKQFLENGSNRSSKTGARNSPVEIRSQVSIKARASNALLKLLSSKTGARKISLQ